MAFGFGRVSFLGVTEVSHVAALIFQLWSERAGNNILRTHLTLGFSSSNTGLIQVSKCRDYVERGGWEYLRFS